MIFNVNVSIESNRGKFVSQVETTSAGKAQRKVIQSESFEQALNEIAAEYSRQRSQIEAFYKPQEPVPQEAPAAISESIAESIAAFVEATPKKRGGRPPGSKNKPKVADESPAAA